MQRLYNLEKHLLAKITYSFLSSKNWGESKELVWFEKANELGNNSEELFVCEKQLRVEGGAKSTEGVEKGIKKYKHSCYLHRQSLTVCQK